MIVRIMGEGQFKLDSRFLDDLNSIDNQIVRYVGSNNEEAFRRELHKLINLVKKRGKRLRRQEIVESDIIVPPGDLTLDEAKKIFRGEGLIRESLL